MSNKPALENHQKEKITGIAYLFAAAPKQQHPERPFQGSCETSSVMTVLDVCPFCPFLAVPGHSVHQQALLQGTVYSGNL